jgi:hypothetical protein
MSNGFLYFGQSRKNYFFLRIAHQLPVTGSFSIVFESISSFFQLESLVDNLQPDSVRKLEDD